MNLRPYIRGCYRSLHAQSTKTLADRIFAIKSSPKNTSTPSWNSLTVSQPKCPSDLIPAFENRPSLDDQQTVKLGRSFKQYYDARQTILGSPTSGKFDRDEYHRLGSSVLNNKNEVNKHFENFTSTIPSHKSFIRNFNELAPLDHLVDHFFMTVTRGDKYELPIPKSYQDFNPLFLVDMDKAPRLCGILGSKLSKDDTAQVKTYLNKLCIYGKSAVTFHLQLHGQSKDIFHEKIDRIAKQSLVYKWIKNRDAQKYIRSMMQVDQANEKIVYQCIGYMMLTESFPSEWLQRLFQTKTCQLKPKNDFPDLTSEDFSLLKKMPSPSKTLGTDSFLTTVLRASALGFQDETMLKEHAQTIFEHIDSQNMTEFDTPTLLSLMAFRDINKFESFIRSFFDHFPTHPSQRISDVVKSCIFEHDVPIPRISGEGDSISLSILTINNSILRDQDPASDTHWSNGPILKRLTSNVSKLGSSRFAFLIKLNLLSFSDRHYINSLEKLLLSTELKKYFLEDSGYFMSQPSDSPLLARLIKNRHSSGLIIHQFYQNFALQTPEKQVDFVKSTVSLLVTVLDNLDVEEAEEFLAKAQRELNSREFSLTELNKKRVHSRLDESKNDLLRALRPIGETPVPATDMVASVGQKFVSYVIMRYHLNLNLSGFLQSVQEDAELIKLIFPGKQLYQAVGSKILSGEHSFEAVERLLNEVHLRKRHAGFKPNLIGEIRADVKLTPNRDVSCQGFESTTLALPAVSATGLHKLLLINYFHSRTLLADIESGSRNPNRLPDIITMFGSMGSAYYDFLVHKKLAEWSRKPVISSETLEELAFWLSDKKFKMLVSNATNMSYSLIGPTPEIDRRIQGRCSELERKYSRNEYYRLRYHNQAFNQYVGSLVWSDPEALEKWFDGLVGPVVAAPDAVKRAVREIQQYT